MKKKGVLIAVIMVLVLTVGGVWLIQVIKKSNWQQKKQEAYIEKELPTVTGETDMINEEESNDKEDQPQGNFSDRQVLTDEEMDGFENDLQQLDNDFQLEEEPDLDFDF